MKPNFKKGDTVICIDNCGSYEDCLDMGKQYTVYYIFQQDKQYFCDVKDEHGYNISGASVHRFAKAEQPKKENNMKLKCINAKDSTSLREGQTYTKVDTNEHGNISVMDSIGRILTHYYKPERFVEVKEKVATPTPAFDITKEYKTRDGNKVKILVISEDPHYPVLGVFQEDNGQWSNATWNLNGKFISDSCDDGRDLIEVRPTQYYMPASEGFVSEDVHIDLEDETVTLESYTYSFEQLRKIVNEIDK